MVGTFVGNRKPGPHTGCGLACQVAIQAGPEGVSAARADAAGRPVAVNAQAIAAARAPGSRSSSAFISVNSKLIKKQMMNSKNK
jgi:hypothetical protein